MWSSYSWNYKMESIGDDFFYVTVTIFAENRNRYEPQ